MEISIECLPIKGNVEVVNVEGGDTVGENPTCEESSKLVLFVNLTQSMIFALKTEHYLTHFHIG